ncbi:spore coat U domain-containing protein [Sinorhizobium meliloti]|uniref:Csu type fimbrial protein n=1 Tax=Rhizobium meliloti TaxID=382 RepID=UPI0001E4D377|nr:spore coat protein U domain-containing protein [Sinorhizobium meliloti]AEG58266.1 Spore coat protein U [Sinorhizobium meliloti AK83]MDE4589206.1 spore coat U domain-containing protein [Sinorhizobium meliloti]SEJ60257.1 Spore coat protein U (SCPU) domain-containing protein [Sinorhizobium meliloti]
MLRAVSFLLFLLLPSLSFAQSCNFSISNLNFGAVDTLSGSQTNSTATININCTGLTLQRILICPNLGAGSGGSSSAAARQMLNGANLLNYQLYSDSARSVVWGSFSWPYPARSPAYALTLDALGSASGTITIYGAVQGGQSVVAPGTYLSTFSGGEAPFRYFYSLLSSDCTTAAGTPASPTFTVNATVAANCLVAVQNIDFGTKGVLSANSDATGGVSVTCTPGTTYTVSLNGGTTNSPPTARKMSKGTETVTYGLYKDAARSQPWGDATTPGSTVAGAGNGLVQQLTVYGRVPPQTTPSPGTYTDTVVVTLTY